MTDNSDAEQAAPIADALAALNLEEAEDEVRAFNQDRARQRRLRGLHVCTVIPFPKRGSPRGGRPGLVTRCE
jgi:hypothetical protein